MERSPCSYKRQELTTGTPCVAWAKLARAVVLNLWGHDPLGIEQPFHKGRKLDVPAYQIFTL